MDKKIGNAVLEVQVGLRSVRTWMDYSYDISEADTTRLIALEGTLTRLKEQAAALEETPGELFADVEKDVEGRMTDWLALEGEVAEAYVQRTADADAESIKAVETAYEQDDSNEVSADDVAYTKLYVQMLDVVFELKRLNARCKQETANTTTYEDVTFERAAATRSRGEFLRNIPTMEEAEKAIVDCVAALDAKYLHGEFPLVLEMTVSYGTLTPDTDEGCVEAFKKLDDLLSSKFNLEGKSRNYRLKDTDRDYMDCPHYEVEV